MSRSVLCPFVVLALLAVGCSQPAATTDPTPTAVPAPAPATPPAPVATSDAVAKADALIAEMRRNEAALQKFDRENPPPPAPRLDDLIRPASTPMAAPAPASSQAGMQTAAGLSSAASTIPTSQTRDEQWWKNEMHARELRVQESAAQMNAARASMNTTANIHDTTKNRLQAATAQSGFQNAEAEFQKWSRQVAIDRGEVERLREDARRAGIPPGWLRWP